MRGLVSGSFDPITLGHSEVIREATKICDEVVVCIFINPEKNSFFSLDDKLEFLKTVCNKYDNVKADFYDGFVSDYCKTKKIDVILRGFRNENDYAYEVEMAKYNKNLCGINTILLPASERLKQVSSSKVREALINNGDLTEMLGTEIVLAIKNKLNNKG